MASTYTQKNAFGNVGVGGQELLSGEQVLQGVMNPQSNALNVAVVDSSGNPVTPSNPLPVTPGAVTPSASTKATFVRGSKAPASASVPEALAAVGTYVWQVVICGQRGAQVANTSSVFIDSISTNAQQNIELTPGAAAAPGINGSSYTITAPPGKFIDLGDIYVDVITVGDGVTWLGVL